MIETKSIQYRTRQDIDDVRTGFRRYRPENTLIQVFSGVLDQDCVRAVMRELNEVFPTAPVIGMSTGGEILDAVTLDQTIVISFCFFQHTTVKSCLVRQNDDLAAAGNEIAQGLKQADSRAIIVFGCGLKNRATINSEPLLRAIQEEIGNVVISGGQAGDNGLGKTTFVFSNDGLTESGVAAVSLNGERLCVQNSYSLSWVPIGKNLTITEADGNRVRSIDHRTPQEVYRHYLGAEILETLPVSAAEFPLMIVRHGIQLAIHPTGVNDDGSFDYIHNFYAGEQVRFGYCHAGLLKNGAQATYDAVRSHRPQAIFVYSCVSRKWVLGSDIKVDLAAVAGIAPSAGCYCYGEYFLPEGGRASLFSQTLTELSLSESDQERPAVEALPFALDVKESRQFRTLRVLARLVETSTSELECVNNDLATLARKDQLTGLANRRRLDETLAAEVKRHSRSRGLLSIILVDIDFFKQYNDTYGHVEGDNCLRGIGSLIDGIMKRADDLGARYGGEEFCCVLPGTDQEGALAIAKEIETGVEKLGLAHATSKVAPRVTVSLGVLTVRCSSQSDPVRILEKCDGLLYRAKHEGRNGIASGAFGLDEGSGH